MASSDTSSITNELLCLEDVNCPICLKNFTNLQKLNEHLDKDHGFDNNRLKEKITSLNPPKSQRIHLSSVKDLRSASSRSNSSLGSINTKQHSKNNKTLESKPKESKDIKRREIDKSHWLPFIKGESCCNYCHRKLNPSRGFSNCSKCGRLYCKRHCINRIKLNLDACFDPTGTNSRWYICCHDCFTSRPGYDDYGCYTDLTDSFIKIRNKKSEDLQLIKLQLENRLVRLLDGLFLLFKRHRINGNFVSLVKLNIEKNDLEQSIVPWKADNTVQSCHICERKFNLIIRKHHCRLCGNIVCDSMGTSCSHEVSIIKLRKNASDLPFQESIDQLLNQKVDIGIRVCSNCLKLVYTPRKFKRDMIETNNTPIMNKYRSIANVSTVIERLLPQLQRYIKLKGLGENLTDGDSSNLIDLREVTKVREKLLKSFGMYNLLTRQLILLKPINEAERQIQKSVQIRSAQFVNEKMLPLKNLENLINNNNISVDEDSKRTSTSTSEQSSISNGMLNSLNITTTTLNDMMNQLTVKEIKQYREELMVLKEQTFLINSMIEENKRLRKFDEIKTLTKNLEELKARAKELEELLGDQGFK